MIIYDTRAKFKAAEKAIWLAKIKKIIADDRFIRDGKIIERGESRAGDRDTKDKIIDKSTGEWVDGKSLSDAVLNNRNNFPKMGFSGGKLNTESGFCTAYAVEMIVEVGQYTGMWAMQEPVSSWACDYPLGIQTDEELFIQDAP